MKAVPILPSSPTAHCVGRRHLLRASLAGALGWVLAGCGGDGSVGSFPVEARPVLSGTPAVRDELAGLYDEARRRGEDTVVVYGAAVDAEWEPLWLAFQADFPGLKVIYMHVSPTQVMSRIDAERSAGNHQGDLLMQPVNVQPLIARRGYFDAFRPLASAELAAEYRDESDFVHYPFSKVFGLAYNTNQVAADALPRHFDDILQSHWHKRFSYVKPVTAVGTTDVAFAILLRAGVIDMARLEQLHRTGLFTGPDSGVTYVSQGRLALNLWSYLAVVVRQRTLGAPVAIRFIPDFSVNVPFGFGLVGGAPHPAAGRLLKSWLFTPRGQAALANEAYMLGTMPGAPAPPFYPAPGPERDRFHRQPAPEQLLSDLDAQRGDLRKIFFRPAS
ncbi:MAG: substrate-binding domain-containing protein [Azoarcus sp.]|nr:substrate-binding domain-containing protein [Azoarcus sp.]